LRLSEAVASREVIFGAHDAVRAGGSDLELGVTINAEEVGTAPWIEGDAILNRWIGAPTGRENRARGKALRSPGFMRVAWGALSGRDKAGMTGRMLRPALSRTFSAADGLRRNPGLRVACPGLCCFVLSGHGTDFTQLVGNGRGTTSL
jgi:hypothetical protein